MFKTRDEVLSAQKYIRIGDTIPDFKASSTKGDISFYDYFAKTGSKYMILFSHPKAHTPVCTTELGRVAQLKDEWARRNTSVIALSVDTDAENQSWIADDIQPIAGCDVDFPIINDDYTVATTLGMINPDHLDARGMPLTARTVFFIDAAHKVRATITYPASTGRNFNEILRVLDSIILTDARKVATGENWQVGDKAIVLPNITTEEARKLFDNVEEVRPFLRYTQL